MNDAEKNVEAVRRGYAAFNSADMKTLTELFHENATWHTPGRSSVGGMHKGRDAVFAYFGRLGSETKGTFKAPVQQLLRSEDGHVVGVHRNTGKRNGKSLDVSCCIVFTLKDGRVISGSEYIEDLYAWDEFWS